LEHSEQFRLEVDPEFSDLVEEERPAAGLFESAAAPGDGSGERASLVPEQFAFEQRRAQRGTVHLHERMTGALRVAVDRGRNQFLACAALSENENGLVRGRDSTDGLENRHHALRAADESSSHGSGSSDSGSAVSA